jgi:signal transduction histidine kinase/Tfp pilus assembly protein PilF
MFFNLNFVFAQDSTDSLRVLLKSSKGEEKVTLLNQLSIQSRNISLIESLDYANNALALSREINYKFGEGEGYKNRGVVYYFQRKYPEALKEYELAYKIFDDLDDKSKISAVLNNRAIISVLQGEYEKALKDYNESVAVNIELGNLTSVANIYNNIGMVYSKWGDTEKTLEYYNKSLEISIKEGNKVGKAAAYNNMAMLKRSLGYLDEALEYYQKAIKVNEEMNDIAGLARCLSNMSSVYTKIGEPDKALVLLKESLEYEKQLNDDQGVLKSYEKIGQLQIRLKDYNGAIKSFEYSIEVAENKNDKEQIIVSYRYIGRVYEKQEDYIKAIVNYKISLKLSQEIDNSKYIALSYYNIGECYGKFKKNNKAINYIKQSVYISEEHSFITLLKDGYSLLSDLYQRNNNYRDALEYKSKYIELHKKIYNDENQKVIAELQTKFETEKKEKEILELRSEKQRIKQKNLFIVIISTVLVLLVLISLLYSRFLIKKRSIKLLDNKNELLKHTNKELTIAKEKAEESNRLKTAFLANVSHEIRTPLNSIIGFSEFLIDPEFDESHKKEFLSTINLHSDLLLNLIDDIIDIARIESGQLKIRKEKISLNKLMEETYLLMKDQMQLNKDKVGFNYIKDQSVDIEIYTDPFRVKQVLKNLLDNSFKFTKEGHVYFKYSIINDNSFILFEVEDTGIGIEDKYQGLIFDRFYKAPQDKKYIYRGTGIGLSIVKNLVNEMGGEISLQSIKNKGSKFSFTIPYESDSNSN